MSKRGKQLRPIPECGLTYRDSERVIVADRVLDSGKVRYHTYTLEGMWLYRETCDDYMFACLVEDMEFELVTRFDRVVAEKVPRHDGGCDWGRDLQVFLRRGEYRLARWPSGGYWNRGWWHPNPTSIILYGPRGARWKTLIEGSWNRQLGLEHAFKIAEFFHVSVGSVVAAITDDGFKKTTLVFEGEIENDKAN